jgi:hypothetical protein
VRVPEEEATLPPLTVDGVTEPTVGLPPVPGGTVMLTDDNEDVDVVVRA